MNSGSQGPDPQVKPESTGLESKQGTGEGGLSPSEERYFPRLNLAIRVQHIILMVSCLVLIPSGLPLRYPDSSIAQFLFGVTGGVGTAGLLHRLGAGGLIGVGCFHMVYVIFSREGRREFIALLPRLADFRDLGQNVAHFFNLRRSRARFGRWGYIQKFDYWAVYWGMVVMITTGLVLWFESTSMAVFPKFVLDIAREAHSDEALLATLAIIIWHMYNVHLNPTAFPMNMAWLTGNISEHELRVEHPLEYERIMAEGARPPTAPMPEPTAAPGERRLFPGAWAYAAILVVAAAINLGLWLTFRVEYRPAQKQPATKAGEETRRGVKPEAAAVGEVPPGRVHPVDWISAHPPGTRAAAQKCHECHEPSFCVACHQTARPADHAEPNWPSHHSWAVAQPQRNCQTCHANHFCTSCHESHRPTSHQKRWLDLHGQSSLLQGANCALCHDQAYCAKCHQGMPMPHPETFVSAHQSLAKRDDRACLKCHQQSECLTCHRGTKPDSHKAGWMERHGKWAVAKKQNCSICHSQTFCSTCHRGVNMPHPPGWTETKHRQAAKKDASACLSCHRQDYCVQCHGLPMPHPGDWMPKHGREAEALAAACTRCHKPGQKPYCLKCHQALPPPSHTEGFKKDHAPATADKWALCALCHQSSHTQDACLTCHKVPMPHRRDFAAQHAKVASFKPDSACLRCHTREKTCNTCHPG